jgi:biotin transport system substrate-specific component
MQNRGRITVRELCFIGVFAIIIAAFAQIAIPQPGGVPFTLQVWAVSLAGIILGFKNSVIATLVYILLGAVGAPVFSRFSGGFGVILGPVGGFILSFPILAAFAAIGQKYSEKRTNKRTEKQAMFPLILGLTIGNIINLGVGLIWFSTVTGNTLLVSFGMAVLPFIPVTVFQIALVPVMGRSVNTALRKAKLIIKIEN